MGRPNAVEAAYTLELPAQVYDELERKLLDAGYDFAFTRGPGSPIDLSLVGVVWLARQDDSSTPAAG